MALKRRIGAALSGFSESMQKELAAQKDRDLQKQQLALQGQELDETARRNTAQIQLWRKQGLLSDAEAQRMLLQVRGIESFFPEDGRPQPDPIADPEAFYGPQRKGPDVLRNLPLGRPGSLLENIQLQTPPVSQTPSRSLIPAPTPQGPGVVFPRNIMRGLEGAFGPQRSRPTSPLTPSLDPSKIPEGFAAAPVDTPTTQQPSVLDPSASAAGEVFDLTTDPSGPNRPPFRSGTVVRAPTGGYAADMTPAEKRRMLYQFAFDANPLAVFPGPGQSPYEREHMAKMLERIETEGQVNRIPIVQAVRESVGDPSAGGITRIDRTDPITAQAQTLFRTTGGLARELAADPTTPGQQGSAPGQTMIVQQPLGAGQQKRISRSQLALATMKENLNPLMQMAQRLNEGDWNMWGGQGAIGPFAGRWSELRSKSPGALGLDDPAFNELVAYTAMARNAVINAISGAAVSGQEAERLRQQTPEISDRFPMYLAKTLASIQNAEDTWNAYAMQIPLTQYYDSGRGERMTNEELEVLAQEFYLGGTTTAGAFEVPNPGDR